MKTAFILIISSFTLLVSCSKTGGSSTPIDCSGAAKSFTGEVNPIIQSSCAINSGCHASGSSNGPGPLISYQQVFNSRSSIRAAVANGSMPKDRSLSASQKNAILCWIDNGAVDN